MDDELGMRVADCLLGSNTPKRDTKRLHVKKADVAAVVENTTHATAMLRLLEACLHQIGTDSDLETVTGAAKYAALEHDLRNLVELVTGRSTTCGAIAAPSPVAVR